MNNKQTMVAVEAEKIFYIVIRINYIMRLGRLSLIKDDYNILLLSGQTRARGDSQTPLHVRNIIIVIILLPIIIIVQTLRACEQTLSSVTYLRKSPTPSIIYYKY